MKIIAISDTHNHHDEVDVPDDVDLLIHGGDMTHEGTMERVRQFSNWLHGLEIPALVIAGNHDKCVEEHPNTAVDIIENNNVQYLCDERTEVNGYTVYGTPWSPEFGNLSFNFPRGSGELKEKWRQIPEDTDILVTHAPPKGILDFSDIQQIPAGAKGLRDRVEEVNPDLHIFGHIHEGYGRKQYTETTFYNASFVGKRGRCSKNDPWIIHQ